MRNRYQVTLHTFNTLNRYVETILAIKAVDLTREIEKIHEKYDVPIILLPNNIEMHITLLESLTEHITIEELQEVF